MLEKYRGSFSRTLSLIEEQAHSVLTPYAFKIFQEEFGRVTQYSVLQENSIEFVLQYYEEKTSQKYLVLWDGEMTSCSQKLMPSHIQIEIVDSKGIIHCCKKQDFIVMILIDLISS